MGQRKILVIGFFIIALVLFLLALQMPDSAPKVSTQLSSRSPKSISVQEFNKIVNFHLQKSAQQQRFENQQSAMAKGQMPPAQATAAENSSASLPMRQEDEYNSLDRDLNQNSVHYDVRMNPEDLIGYQIQMDRDRSEYDEQYRQAFIQAFLNNAKQAGLEVVLDQNLVVKQIKQISDRQPNSVKGGGTR